MIQFSKNGNEEEIIKISSDLSMENNKKDTYMFAIYSMEIDESVSISYKPKVIVIVAEKTKLQIKMKGSRNLLFFKKSCEATALITAQVGNPNFTISCPLTSNKIKSLIVERLGEIKIEIDTVRNIFKQCDLFKEIIRHYNTNTSYFSRAMNYLNWTNGTWLQPDTSVYIQSGGKTIREKVSNITALYLKMFFSLRVANSKIHTDLMNKLTIKSGIKLSTFKSTKLIDRFVKYFQINMKDYHVPVNGYSSFNEFFARRFKEGKREIENPEGIACPSDSRIIGFKSIETAKEFWIKGKNFTANNLLQKEVPVKTIFVCRLAPQDYHRFHSPVKGKILSIRKITGKYQTVHPLSIRKIDVLTDNYRVVIEIKTLSGIVYFIAIGAALVGCIKLNFKENMTINVMDELGWFEYGGSTVVMLFDHEVRISETILNNSLVGFETLMKVGNCLGAVN